MKISLLLAALLLAAPLAQAQSLPARPAKYTPVNDYTGTLAAAEIQSISKKLIDFEARQSTQIVIVMIPTLGSQTIERYANDLYRAWGIGQKGKDNGVLVLVAKNDRKARIEVGYGAEGAITDLAAQQIIADILRPNFRNNAYGKGLSEAADKLMSLIDGEYSNADRVALASEQGGDWDVWDVIIFVAFMFFVFYVLYRISRRKRAMNAGSYGYSSGGGYAPVIIPPVASSGSWGSSSSSDYSSSGSSDSSWSSSSSSDSSWSSSSSSDSSWSSSSDWGGGDSGGGGSSGDW